MTTDRTQPARPAAPNHRPSAAPAERRDGSAFAALLDAQAPAPQPAREERVVEPRDAGARHDQGVPEGQPHAAAAGHELSREAARHDLLAAPPIGPPVVAPPVEAPAAAGQPVVVPPFVATVPAEAPAPASTAALPVATAPVFMVAPEAVVPVPPQPAAAPVVPAEAPAVLAPQPVAPAPAVPSPAPATGETGPQPPAPAPAPAAPRTPVAQAPEAELPAEPAAAPVSEAPAPEPHVAAPARFAVNAEPAPAAQAPAAEPVAQAPASTPPSGPVAPERAVPLHRAPAAVSTLLHVAVDRGITHARMALRPAELGGIEIRLQATAGGVAAQVVADSPEAARLLAQAGDDLRRALEARAVTLISLEVSTSSDQGRQHSARGDWTDLTDTHPTSSDRTIAEGDAEPAPTTQTVIELPGGLLVDVLA